MLGAFYYRRSDRSSQWFCSKLRNHRFDNRNQYVPNEDRVPRTRIARSEEGTYLSKFPRAIIFNFWSVFHSYSLAPWPDLALKPKWWSKKINNLGTAESWRRHYRTLRRRDDKKPDLVVVHIPEDLDVYFGPPSVYISLPQGKLKF